MSTATTDLIAQLDATLAAAAELDAKRRSDSLAEYRAVLRGVKKVAPADLLALLDRCALTPADFRADAEAWAKYQHFARQAVSQEQISNAMTTLKAATEKEEARTQAWAREAEELRSASREAHHAWESLTRTNDAVSKGMEEIKASSPRLFG